MKIKRLKSENGTPVLPSPRQFQDPTKQGSKRHAAERMMKRKLSSVKKKIEQLVRDIPKEKANVAINSSTLEFLRKETMKNAGIVLDMSDKYYFNKSQYECGSSGKVIGNEFSHLMPMVDGSSIRTNARVYRYRVNPSLMQTLIERIRLILEEEYIGGTRSYTRTFWMDQFVRSAYMDGARDAVSSALSITSQNAGEELTSLLRGLSEGQDFDVGLLNRASLVGSRTFELMKGLTDQTRADLAATLSNGIERGLGVIELSDQLKDRIEVSGSRAARIIRTEVNQSYRQATRRETDQMNEDVYSGSDFELRMLWFSALSKTTRSWHARRHARTYTTEQVDEFYSKAYNAINCYCSQTQVLVNKKTGEVFQKDLQGKMMEQKVLYFGEDPEDRPPASG